jgi:PAS domain S-box-containing protein
VRTKNLILGDQISLTSSLDLISEGILIIQNDFDILYFNEEAKKICGCDLIGGVNLWPSQLGVFHLDRGTMFTPEELPVYRALKGEHLSDFRLFIRNDHLKNGKVVSCNAGPITEDDKIIGAIVFFRDITDSINQKEILNQERTFFHNILNSVPAFVFSKDLSGKTTFKNKKFEDLKENSLNFLTEGFEEEDLRVISIQQTIETEKRIIHEGRERHFLVQRMPLTDQKGKPFGISGIAFDTTEADLQKKMREDEQTRLASASKLAALGMLAAEISHEINNPLAIIRTSSWILRKLLKTDSVPVDLALEKLQEIDETIQRISDIITSVKNLSRDSSQETMLEVGISEIMKDVHSICGPRFRSNGIEFHFDNQGSFLSRKVRCLRVQLSEVLINLLVNAVDALEGVHAEKRWISLELFEDSKGIIFRVRDGGAGVSPEIANKIFTPFFSTKDIGRGTGLGLSISQEIMKKHGGSLNWNPSISRSCFDVQLPL